MWLLFARVCSGGRRCNPAAGGAARTRLARVNRVDPWVAATARAVVVAFGGFKPRVWLSGGP